MHRRSRAAKSKLKLKLENSNSTIDDGSVVAVMGTLFPVLRLQCPNLFSSSSSSSSSSKSCLLVVVYVVVFIAVSSVLVQPSNGAPNSSKSSSSSLSLNGPPCIYIGCVCKNELVRCSTSHVNSGEDSAQQQQQQRISLFPKRYTTFESYPFNVTLKLNDNELEIIPDDRLANLQVEMADFSNNKIYRVSPDAFRDVKRLARLDLSKNYLTSIYQATFKPIEMTLMSLRLASNHLYQMETTRLANVLAVAQRLESLNLDNNRLANFPNLAKLARLRYLSFDNNFVETLIDFDTGEELLPKSLIELSMKNNRLKFINSNFFGHLFRLRHLNLASNQISTFGENSFVRLRNLSTLVLSRNHLKHIPSRIFYTLVSLDFLDLSSQHQTIKKLDDFAFDRQSSATPIRKIDLSNNGIESIDNKAFCSRNRSSPYVNVKELDLSNNHLTKLNACTFKQLYRGFQENLNNELKYAHQVANKPPRSRLPTFYRTRPFVKTGAINRTGPSVEDELLVQRSLRCDCEVTRTARIADLEGNCLLVDPATRAVEHVYQMREYQCPDHMLIRTSNDVNKHCMNQTEYDCTAFSASALFGVEPNDFYNSHLIEISDEDPYTTTTLATTSIINVSSFETTNETNATNSSESSISTNGGYTAAASMSTRLRSFNSSGVDYESSSSSSSSEYSSMDDLNSSGQKDYRNNDYDNEKTKKATEVGGSSSTPVSTTSASAVKLKVPAAIFLTIIQIFHIWTAT